ncbi:Uncharacterized protein Adt_13907 [Abeliophyllum distichum]|uniref:DUF1985 domain-containing protein n=1 Tax=Abeliophyllum distichum TaxID=126358 RepID=A0ABD1TY48_9LAMI
MVSAPPDVILNLNSKMNEAQKGLFGISCFGNFLDLNELHLQHQLIHKMLLMEVKQPKKDEMWFKISGKLIRFSIEEFCVITGLKCIGCDDLSKMKSGRAFLRQKYFSHLKCIYRKDVEDVFMSMPVNSADEDVVKIGMLYLITSFLFTTPYKKLVTEATFSLIESEDIETYAWGKELFKNTFSYLKIAMTKRTYDETMKKEIFTYRLYGFPLAFQTWIYESLPCMDGKICKRLDYNWPRILNWTNSATRVTVAELETLDLPDLEIRGIEPDEEERCASYLTGLYQINRAAPDIEDVDDDDFVDPSVRLKKSLKTDQLRACNESKNAKNSTSSMKEDEPRRYNEKLNKMLSDIRLRHDQIISQQVDLKFEVRAIQRFVDEMIGGFLEELKAKLDGMCSTEVNHGQIVVYNSLNTGIGNGIGEQQNISDLLDDNFYTDDVMEQVEEIIKSAEKLKHSDEIESEGSDVFIDEVATEIPVKRQRKPGILTKSPYLHGRQPIRESTSSFRFEACAFDIGLGQPLIEDVRSFDEWFHDGYRPDNM